ncbi:CRAL/TRIO domain-containing protein [Sparassis latifolia]|uniref:CRAL/TRIO domain-containing protein n=1 Tax=Sparassis crispa TaxID=139825 RepID=A0A401H1H1_9APHY|nr:CRAL/TRIO domain-containing protein [Sparassis crispa]GBE88286.1 CRAL/TRIO domain-containing protein [Sparassis crispa]
MSITHAETIYTPLPPPNISSKTVKEPPELSLTSDHQRLFDEVLAHYSNEKYTIPAVEDGKLREEEKFWLSYECLLRYLRATKWHSAHGVIKRIDATLKWRREYGVYDLITASYVEPEAVTGKMVLFGYDIDGRPALYLRPSKQNTSESIRQLHLVVWLLERTVDLMGPGVETIALMVDFADRSRSPSFGQSHATLNILQDHYPERLGRALITNVPFLLNAFFKIITPFVDPVTRPKMRFNPQCVSEGLFEAPQLLREWGGDCVFEYEHEQYWPVLVQLCAERRAKMREGWRARGATVGVREWDIKVAVFGEGLQDTPNGDVQVTERVEIAANGHVAKAPDEKVAVREIEAEKVQEVQ